MENVTFVILGGTGDLAKRKLYPAIAQMAADKKIKKFVVVALSRNKKGMKSLLKQSQKFRRNVKGWSELEIQSYYQKLDFYNLDDYKLLNVFLTSIERKHGLTGNRLFYLATLPQHFDAITSSLSKSKLTKTNGWSRVVYEKPFGDNLKSAKKINKCIHRVFGEKQVYRIDHYLGKELVGNIALMRFTNRVLEPLWNRKHVKSVNIIMSEKIDVGTRGNFYDKYGALKDVVQNHALQLLALTAMEPPKSLVGEYVRSQKAKVLKRVRVKDVVLGQYRGYRKTKGVKRSSKTETFAALELRVKNSRWRGVSFFIKVGKALDKNEVSIHLNFKKVNCLLSNACPTQENHFTMKIQPNSGFHLKLNAKMPGVENTIMPVKMNFAESSFGMNTPQAYQVLLEDVIKGDQSMFVRNDEIEAAWKIVDSVKREKIHSYKKGGKGPKLVLN